MEELHKFDEFIPYGKHHIDQSDIDAVVDVLKNGWLTQGPKIDEFEDAISNYLNVKHAVLVNNGTSALQLAYHSVGVNNKSKLITTPLTFVATVNGAIYRNSDVELVDIDQNTWNIDTEEIKQVKDFTHIAPVDFAGCPADLPKISEIADENNAKVIEDAAHAMGAMIKDNHIGSIYSDLTTFSFHPVKHIAMGEGGCIVTNNDDYANKLKLLRTHGISKSEFKEDVSKNEKPYYYEMQELSYNFRVPDILCALGLSQFQRIDDNLRRRNELAEIYRDLISDWGKATFQQTPEGYKNAYHIFPIKFNNIGAKNRDFIFRELRKLNIGVQIHYIPVHLHPYHQKIKRYGELPNAMDYYNNALTLPLYPELKNETIKIIFDNVKQLYNDIIDS